MMIVMQPVLQFPHKSEARRLGMEAETMKAVFADIEAERADHDPQQIERKDAGGAKQTMSAARPSASQILEPCRKKVPTMAASQFIFCNDSTFADRASKTREVRADLTRPARP